MVFGGTVDRQRVPCLRLCFVKTHAIVFIQLARFAVKRREQPKGCQPPYRLLA